jgi:hypothetical protein
MEIMFLQNVGTHLSDYMMPHTRRPTSEHITFLIFNEAGNSYMKSVVWNCECNNRTTDVPHSVSKFRVFCLLKLKACGCFCNTNEKSNAKTLRSLMGRRAKLAMMQQQTLISTDEGHTF